MNEKMSLEEYAEKHGKQVQPAEDRQQMEKIAAEIGNRERQSTEAEKAKESILQQLEEGNEPQLTLYTALKCIGLLSHDMEWTDQAQGYLDKIYGDIAQQSLLDDNAAIASHRLQEQEKKYHDKVKHQLERDLANYNKIAKSLTDALSTLNEMEREDQQGDQS